MAQTKLPIADPRSVPVDMAQTKRRVRCFLCHTLHLPAFSHFVGWTVNGWICPRKVRLYQCDPCFEGSVANLNRRKHAKLKAE